MLRVLSASKQKKNELNPNCEETEIAPEVEAFPAPCSPDNIEENISDIPEAIEPLHNTIPVRQRSAFHITPTMKVVLAVIKDALVSGEDVTLPGLGAFKIEDHPARTGRNPRTGETIQIPACSRVHFKMTGQLRQLLNHDQ